MEDPEHNERPTFERAGIDRPRLERPTLERATLERPTLEGPRLERPGDGATFAPARVGAGGRLWRPGVIGLAWVLALGGVVFLAVLGRGSDAKPDRVALSSIVLEATAVPVPSPAIRGSGPPPGPPLFTRSVSENATDPIQVALGTDGDSVAVAGSVRAPGAAWIAVSVTDRQGQLLGTDTLMLLGPNAEMRPDRTPGFQILIDLPTSARSGWLTFEVSAYDGIGQRIASVWRDLAPPQAVCGTGRDCRSS